MFKVNLEKKLLKQNTKHLTIEEENFLKFVNDTLKQQSIDDELLLTKAGFSNLIEGFKSSSKKDADYLTMYKKYGNKLFTIEQIKSICLKYDLRFLETKYYKGFIPAELPSILKEFEDKNHLSAHNLYICAPPSSFSLQKKPKDPLLFKSVNNENTLFVLIYKWGKDLSMFRCISGFFKKNYIFLLIMVFFLGLYCLKEGISFYDYKENLIMLILGILFTFISAVLLSLINESSSYKEDWNSPFE